MVGVYLWLMGASNRVERAAKWNIGPAKANNRFVLRVHSTRNCVKNSRPVFVWLVNEVGCLLEEPLQRQSICWNNVPGAPFCYVRSSCFEGLRQTFCVRTQFVDLLHVRLQLCSNRIKLFVVYTESCL